MNTPKQTDSRPIQGTGVGLRSCHYHYLLQHRPPIPWLEAVSDNYMVDGGPALHYLDALREHYPMVLHGVGLSLGSADPLNPEYLSKLKRLVDRVKPAWVSDHLCWTSLNGHYFHDLLPLPYTHEVIQHVADRIRRVQEYLALPLLIENVSSYFEYKNNAMPEWECINAIAEKADCFILLDINNIYVSATNHRFDPSIYVKNITRERVKQFHLAGFSDKRRFLFDNHGDIVHQPVWDLYRVALKRFGPVPTLIEWDDNIPKFPVLQAEAEKAQTMMNEIQESIQCH